MKSDLNLSIVDLDYSIHSLFSFNQSMAALFTVKGWTNPAQEMLMTESIAQEKQQRLRKAFERYVEQRDAYRGHALIALLQEVKVDLTAEYDYAQKRQTFYANQAEQEVQGGNNFIAAWTQWIWDGVQNFFGSSSNALAEKYAGIVHKRQITLARLQTVIRVLKQEISKIENLNEKKSVELVRAQPGLMITRHLLQEPTAPTAMKVVQPILNQVINGILSNFPGTPAKCKPYTYGLELISDWY